MKFAQPHVYSFTKIFSQLANADFLRPVCDCLFATHSNRSHERQKLC